MSVIDTANLFSQSPYLYLQAAGSDGSDQTTPGIHLRWDFLRSLGQSHLPKGNLAGTASDLYYSNAGFNKANDFVRICKTEYIPFPVVVDFVNSQPDQLVETGLTREWHFTELIPVPNVQNNFSNVVIKFADLAKYDAVRQTIDPSTNTIDFLKAYDGVMEASVIDKLMFAASFEMSSTNSNIQGKLKVETISVVENVEDAELFISCRKRFDLVADEFFILAEDGTNILQEDSGKIFWEPTPDSDGTSATPAMTAENIKYLRFQCENSYLEKLKLETYVDFITGINALPAGWSDIDSYALSIDNEEVFERLDNADFNIHNAWPRFNDGDKVNVNNYKDKWSPPADQKPEEGLRNFVVSYLDLSRSEDNLEANNVLSPAPDNEDQAQFEISHLKMLKVLALDFHVARMLGLGTIDAYSANPDKKYVYAAVYLTEDALEEGSSASTVRHTYLSLPTNQRSYRQPVPPVLDDITYGLKFENGTPEPTLITDENGYTPFDDSRFINLHIEHYDTLLPFGPFFVPDTEFCFVQNTKPVQYGVEYKEIQEINWRKPEVSNDPEYLDPAGINEVVPVLARETNPLYTHIEREEGEHEYAVYGINWFSRTSPLSNTLQTDETIFPERNTLQPPLNLAAQIIQEEEVLILTTQAEQTRLSNIPASADKTLVRVTFEWNHLHNINFWKADQVEFFFRQPAPGNVKGEIKSAPVDLGNGSFEVATKSYWAFSIYPEPVEVNPAMPPADYTKYIGGVFTVSQKQYIVESIQQSSGSDGPVFRLKAHKENVSFDVDNTNEFLPTENFTLPASGERFIVIENMANVENWPLTLANKVELQYFGSDYTETVTEEDGTLRTLTIGGITHNAIITEIPDKDENGNDMPDSHTGIFTIRFSSNPLTAHPDPNVEWYKGIARISSTSGNEKKVLDVWDISISQGVLTLVVYDTTFAADENYQFIDNYEPIAVGTDIPVNFHPGYRVYLYHENGFENSTLYPTQGEGSRQSFLTARSVDFEKNLHSSLPPPVVLLSREILKPLKPDLPSGPVFATRPDFYGKSTYTFDTSFNTSGRNPFAIVFYRANERSVLDVLYNPETVRQILTDLAVFGKDEYFTDRWNKLVNCETNSNGFLEVGGYKFPNPNNNTYFIPDPNPSHPPIYPFTSAPNPHLIKEVVKTAINRVFLPLTQQPVLYQFLKSRTQTSSRKPVIRNSNGDLMIPDISNTSYDPSPMAVKLPAPETGKVRFTDYTLDGASQSSYFYYVLEMNDQLRFGERSEILGPIQLVNSYPPPAPQIKKVISQPANPITGDETAVVFELNGYLQSEGVTNVQIYRAFNKADATSPRTMKLATNLSVDEPLVDNFSDLDYVPFGETLFYRTVALRKVTNEHNEEELIPSYPSEIILSNIIDVFNPESPEITFAADQTIPEKFTSVVLKWSSTTHNGTYYLYRMNNKGNWVKIFQVKSNDPTVEYQLPEDLILIDEEGNLVYHRFKVVVENSSGLLNLIDRELTIGANPQDIGAFSSDFSFDFE